MTGKNILKLLLILIIISQFLFYNFISSSNLYQAFIFVPIYFIYTLVYIVYNEIGFEYIFIPIILGGTLISLLLMYQLEHDYYLCHGNDGETNKDMIYKSIFLIIVLLYIFQNKKCNLSKVAMVFLVITFIQAYYHIYSDEKNEQEQDKEQDKEQEQDKGQGQDQEQE